MKILIVGTGYVGLVTGACFAEMGHSVICLDIDIKKIESLQFGNLPFYEPGLAELVHRNQESKRLLFTSDFQTSIEQCTVCFIAVATPSDEDGSCNLRFVLKAAADIGKYMNKYLVIVNKSTVPVGTSEKVSKCIQQQLDERGIKLPFDVVSNPEFLREGNAINDCMKPDRIIIGSESETAIQIMKQLYSTFNLNHDRLLIMEPASAELSKYAANAMLAARISFMNEMAHLCEKLGANINDIRIAIGSDHRIGYQYLYPGIGYGGSCLPKDLRALKATAKQVDYETPILDAIDEVNQRQRALLNKKIFRYFSSQGGIVGKVIGIWGLSFKPDTDDIRESPSLPLIQELLSLGAFIQVFDPAAMKNANHFLGDHERLKYCSDEYETAQNADAIVLVTDWKQFRFVDFKKILEFMAGRAFFDGRNQYKIEEMLARGFDYFGIGIPEAVSSFEKQAISV